MKRNEEEKANSNTSQQWKVPVKWIQAPIKGSKKKSQVRNRFEVLKTDDEEFPVLDEHGDPESSEAITNKQHQGKMQTQVRRHRAVGLRERNDENKIELCPLEKGKMLGSTEEGEEWKLMPRPLVIDSGAAETVLPVDWFTEHKLRETQESRGGQFYVCAGGKEIPNYGERTLTLSTLDWSSVRNMTFQVTDVTKALGSVSKIVAHGNKVVFDNQGASSKTKDQEKDYGCEMKMAYMFWMYM